MKIKNILLFIPRFFKESWDELKKVSWPTTKQTMRLSLVVVAVSLLFAVFVSGVDFVLKQGIDVIGKNKPVTPATTPGENVPIQTDASPEGQE